MILRMSVLGWLCFAVTVTALAVTGCRTTAEQISFGPYVTHPGHTSMAVRWTSDALADGVVSFTAEGEPTREVTAHIDMLRYPDDPDTRGMSLAGLRPDEIGTAFLYAAHLDELTPGTDYRYTIEFGGRTVEGGFRTMADQPEPFRFIAFGDSHAQDVVADQFAQHEPAFLINLGDTVRHENYHEFQDYFSPTVNQMTRWFPMAAVRGNHEQRGVLFSRLFGLDPDRIYYSFEYGDALFVQLDSSVWRWPNAEENTARMLEWAEQVLSESDANWKIVSFHEPPYDMSYRRSRWGRYHAMEVFRRTGVDLVLNGHAHAYQRYAPLYRKGENEDHPILLINSSGASEIYSTAPRRADPYLVAGAEGNHYVVIDIDGDTLTGRTLRRDGDLIDEFEIRKEGGKPVAEYVEQALPEEPLDRLDRALFRQYMDMPGGVIEEGEEFEVAIGFTAETMSIRYDFRPAADSAHAVELVEPARGEVPAGSEKTVVVRLRARREIRDRGGRGMTAPRVWLDCHYEVNGVEGVISSTRVWSRRPDED